MRDHVAVFPFTVSALPIIRHFNNLQKSYSIERVITWRGLGLNGKDVAYIRNHPPIGLSVTDQFDVMDESWNVLLVDCDSVTNRHSAIDWTEFLRNCLNSHKKLVLVSSNNGDIAACFESLRIDFPDDVTLLTAENNNVHSQENNSVHSQENSMMYSPISVPVLLVGGLTKQCDSLEVVLALKEQFARNDRTISCMINNNMGLLFGLHSFSHILNSTSLTEEDKILRLNQLARDIVQAERPEFIIVEAPDAVMKYSETLPNGFGIRTYMVNQALSPDFFICCMPYGLAFSDFIEAISQSIQNRCGYPISAVHVSNELPDSGHETADQTLSIAYADEGTVATRLKEAREGSIPLFDVIFQGTDKLYQHISELLNQGGAHYVS